MAYIYLWPVGVVLAFIFGASATEHHICTEAAQYKKDIRLVSCGKKYYDE